MPMRIGLVRAAALLAVAAPLGAQPAYEHAAAPAPDAHLVHEPSHLMPEDPLNRLVRFD